MATKKSSSSRQGSRGAAKKSTTSKSGRTTSSRRTGARSASAKSRIASSRGASSRASSTGGSSRSSDASARPLTDHDEIRQWAEERGATPSCVIGTGGRGDTGMIRLDFPGYSGEGSLQEISWDDWFEKFDENNLALMVQDKTARGQNSNFNKLVKRTTAQSKPRTRAAG